MPGLRASHCHKIVTRFGGCFLWIRHYLTWRLQLTMKMNVISALLSILTSSTSFRKFPVRWPSLSNKQRWCFWNQLKTKFQAWSDLLRGKDMNGVIKELLRYQVVALLLKLQHRLWLNNCRDCCSAILPLVVGFLQRRADIWRLEIASDFSSNKRSK